VRNKKRKEEKREKQVKNMRLKENNTGRKRETVGMTGIKEKKEERTSDRANGRMEEDKTSV
jgi:hypothetical protein